MGETIEHVHRLADDQFEDLRELLGRLAGPPQVPADGEMHAVTPYDLGLEPWAFHDPRQRVDVVTYVDDRNQLRHVPTTRAGEVPRHWRRVWLEPAP